MTDIEKIIKSPEIDYSKKEFMYPIYKYSRVLPQTGVQNVAIANGGSGETIFELPPKVFNLSRSELRFLCSVDGDSATAVDSENFVAADLIPQISQLQLYTRGGIFIADIRMFDNYTKAVLKPNIKLQDFLTFDRMDDDVGGGFGLRANNSEVAANTLASGYDGLERNVNFLEPRYVYAGGVATAHPTPVNTPLLYYKINLGLLKETIFSVDKDLFFDEIIYMKIIWNNPAKYIWTSRSLVDPAATPIAYTTGVSIQELQLYLSVETNQEIADQIKMQKKTEKGISLLFPFVNSDKSNLTGSTVSVSLRFNRGQGLRLLKVYHQTVPNQESVNTAYNASNLDGARINSLYTLLNNNRLQEFDINCTQQEDWMMLRDKIAGSILMSSNVYQYNWFWCDDFSGDQSTLDKNQENDATNYYRGLDLSSEQKWDIYLNMAAAVVAIAFNHYTFSITERMLVVNAEGIKVL